MTKNNLEKTAATDVETNASGVKTTQSPAACEPQVASPRGRLRIRTGVKAGGSNDQRTGNNDQ